MRIKQVPTELYVVTSSYQTAKVWNPQTNWSLITSYTGHSNWVIALEYITTDTMASSSNDRTIQIWTISTGLNVRTITSSSEIWSLKLLSDGVSLAGGEAGSQYGNSDIQIYNINTGSLITTLSGHTNYVFDLALMNNNLLASSSSDQTIRLWDLTTNTNTFILTGHTSDVNVLRVISEDILASGSGDTTIKLWNTTSGLLIRTLSNHTDAIGMSVDLLNDRQTLVSGSIDQTIKLWNYKTGSLENSITTNINIRSLAVVVNPPRK